MDDRDAGGSWQGGGEHRDDAPESSPHEGDSGVDPSRPFGHVNPSTPPSYEPSLHEPYGGGPQGPDVPREPLEPLNPWISILLRPRDTVRYVLDTGVWNSWLLVYTVVYLATIPPVVVSMLAQPESMSSFPIEDLPVEIPFALLMGAGVLIMMVIGYPFALLILLLTAWLYKVVGGWLGGIGTTADVRIAWVWGSVVGVYFQYVGLVPNLLAAVYYQTAEEIAPVVQFALLGIGFFLMMPLYIYAMIVSSKAIGEAHQFSAWRGFGTIFFTGVMMFSVFFMFFLMLIFAIGILAAAAG